MNCSICKLKLDSYDRCDICTQLFCSNTDSFSDDFGCSRLLIISYYETDWCFIGKGDKIYFDREINCCKKCYSTLEEKCKLCNYDNVTDIYECYECKNYYCENCTEMQIDVKHGIEYKYCKKCYEKILKNLN